MSDQDLAQRANRPSDRKYPLLGWRNILAAVITTAFVLGWIFWGSGFFDVFTQVVIGLFLFTCLTFLAVFFLAAFLEDRGGN